MDHLVRQRGSGELQVRRDQFPDPEGPVDVDGLLAAAGVGVPSSVAERAEEPGQAEDVVPVQVRDEDLADPARPNPGVQLNRHLQGISKRLFPGCVKSGEKVAFCLPSAGR